MPVARFPALALPFPGTTICSLGNGQGGGKEHFFLFLLVGGQASEDLENPMLGREGRSGLVHPQSPRMPKVPANNQHRGFQVRADPTTNEKPSWLFTQGAMWALHLILGNEGRSTAWGREKCCGLASGPPLLLRPAASSVAWRAMRHHIHAQRPPAKSLAPAPKSGPKKRTPQTNYFKQKVRTLNR